MTQEIDNAYADAASVVPTSVGALLAEEWTINPYSTLPSFLEMMFMQQADAQTRRALTTVLEALQQTLAARRQRLLLRQQEQRRHSSDTASITTSSSADIRSAISRATQSLQTTIQDVEYRLVRLLENVLRNGSTEIATLVYYVLQRQSLASASVSATLSESVYGGRRVKLALPPALNPRGGGDDDDDDDDGNMKSPSASSSNHPQKVSLQPLTRTDQTRLALLLALGPYVETKINALHQHWKQQQQQRQRRQFSGGGGGNVTWKRRLFLILYPLARASIHGANWVCQWRFLIGHAVFFNLPSLLLQQVVRRVTQQDKDDPSSSSSLSKGDTNNLLPETSTTDSVPSSAAEAEAVTAVGQNLAVRQRDDDHTPKQMVKLVVAVAAGALVVSWLTQLRGAYLQHQQERNLLATRNAASTANNRNTPQQSEGANNHQDCRLGSIPPPPPPCPPSRQTSKMTTTRFLDQCPLCQTRPRVQPAASSSGFVFCYKCILAHVRRHAKCPMTKQPCSESRLVRLYEPQYS
jgi:Pex2 / Pex12 amino terminal region